MKAANPLGSNPTPGPLLLGIGLVAAAHFANDAATSMFPALLPSLATRFRLEPSELALLVSVFAVSTSLPQPFFGFLADRIGRHRVGAAGLAVSAALIAGLSLVPSAPWLYAALLIGGLGSSAVHPAGMGLARAASPRNPGLAVALFSSAGMLGGALGPLLAIAVAATAGSEKLAWAAVPMLLAAALLAGLGPRPGAAVSRDSAPGLGIQLTKAPVAWLAAVALLANLVMLTFISGVPVWLVNERGLSETSPVIGLTLATFSLAAAFGGVVGGVLARWMRPSKLIVGSLVLSVVALQSFLLATPGSAPYLIAFGAAGALLGLHGPLLIARAQELTPGGESAVAGILLGATSGAAGLIYAGFGAAQSALGVEETLTATSLLVLPAAHLAATAFESRAEPSANSSRRERCSVDAGCCAALAGA